MRSARHFLPLLVACLAPALLHGQETRPDPTLDPEELGKRYLEAWSSGDPDRVLAFLTDDVFLEDVPNVDNGWTTAHNGKEQVREALVAMYAAMPDMAFEVRSVRALDEGLVCEWTMTGTHTGDWPGLPATGRSIEIRGVSILQVEEGRIAWHRDYYDMFLFLSQLGAVPPLGERDSSEREHAESAVRTLLGAWESGDAESLDDLFLPDAVYVDMPNDRVLTGVPAIKGFVDHVHSWASEVAIEIRSVRAADGFAVAEWTMSGVQDRPIPGMVPVAATGRAFEITGTTIVEVEGRRIRRAVDYIQVVPLMLQLGGRIELPGGTVLEGPGG